MDLFAPQEEQPTTGTELPAPEERPKWLLWQPLGLRRQLRWILFLVLVVLLTYGYCFTWGKAPEGFALDNRFIILEDPRLREVNPKNLRNIFSQDYWWPKGIGGLYRPLTTLSYLFNYAILGNKDVAVGYVLVNLLLHSANTVLAFFVVLMLLQNPWPAFFIATIFAAHPVGTESVANIVGRADLFVTLAVLGGLLLHAKAAAVAVPRQLRWWLALPLGLLFTAGVVFFVLLWASPVLLRALSPAPGGSIPGYALWLAPMKPTFAALAPLPWLWMLWTLIFVAVVAVVTAALASGWRVAPWLLGLTLLTGGGLFCKESALVVVGVVVAYDLVFRLEKRHRSWLVNLAGCVWGFFWKGYAVLLAPLLALFAVRQWVAGTSRPPELPFMDNPMVKFQEHFWSVFHPDFWLARLTAIKVMGRYLQLLLWPKRLSCDYSYNQVPVVRWPFRGDEDWAAIVVLCALALVALVVIRQFKRNKVACFLILFALITFLPTSNLLRIIGSIQAERFLYLPSVGFIGAAVLTVYAFWRWLIYWLRTSPFGPQLRFRPWAPPMQVPVPARLTLFAVLIACSVRSFVRTFDWKNDVTLWTAAVDVCPNSFKTHKSLAFALFEQDPELRTGGDRVIREAEKAAAIMSDPPLPLVYQAGIVAQHLGGYYRVRASRLAAIATEGSVTVKEQSRYWYEQALAAFQHAAAIDRAYNDAVHSRELKRGRSPEEIRDAGDATVYGNLGLVYLGLGQYQNALQAYEFQRRLDPGSADACQNEAAVYLELGDTDQTIIHLLQALILDPERRQTMEFLADIYRQIDTTGCAVAQTPERLMLNVECPIVHNHLCAAYAGVMRTFAGAKRRDRAAECRLLAIRDYRCAPEMFQMLEVR